MERQRREWREEGGRKRGQAARVASAFAVIDAPFNLQLATWRTSQKLASCKSCCCRKIAGVAGGKQRKRAPIDDLEEDGGHGAGQCVQFAFVCQVFMALTQFAG